MILPAVKSLAAALATVLVLAMAAGAQGIAGLTLGAPVPEDWPAPEGSQSDPGFLYRLWQLEGGLTLSATSQTHTGAVLYLEAWPATPGTTPDAPVPGMVYGMTTHAEIAERYGSEGLVFLERGRMAAFDGLAAHFLSYEIAGGTSVVTFVAIQPLAGASGDTAGTALLDSVIVAEGSYLDLIWGEGREVLPGYVPVANPLAGP